MSAVYSVILVTSFVGNGFVIAAVYRDRGLRSAVNLLIVNMSLSDLFIPILALPMRIKSVYWGQEWLAGVTGAILCKLMPFLQDVSIAVSLITMIAIVVERFFKVVCPMKTQPITNKNCRWLIALIWIGTTASHSFYFYTKQLRIINGIAHCVTSWEPAFDDHEALKIQDLAFLVCLAALPFSLLIIIYTIVLSTLHRQKMLFHLESEDIRRKGQLCRRHTLMLFTVAIIFMIVWTPFWVFLCLYDHKLLSEAQTRLAYPIAVVLPFSYSVLNPVVYYIFSQEFRRGFHELLCCQCFCFPEVNSPLMSAQAPLNSNGVSFQTEEEIHLDNLIEGALS